MPFFGSTLITAGIATEILIILLIDYTPAGHTLFGTSAIDWQDWLFVMPFAIGMLALDEARKSFIRSRLAPSPPFIARFAGG